MDPKSVAVALICSFWYTISQRRVMKIFYALIVDGLHMAFDNLLGQFCSDAMYNMRREQSNEYSTKCLNINPNIMYYHEAKGLVTAGGDI